MPPAAARTLSPRSSAPHDPSRPGLKAVVARGDRGARRALGVGPVPHLSLCVCFAPGFCFGIAYQFGDGGLNILDTS